MTPNLLDELEALASAWDVKAERARDDAEYAKAGAFEDCADDLREKAPALADMAKRMEAAERDALPVSALEALLPGTYYMDPPDGGDVSVYEQFRRMAKDAARYWWLREQNATLDNPKAWTITRCDFTDAEDPSRYWVGSDLDAAIDATQEGAG